MEDFSEIRNTKGCVSSAAAYSTKVRAAAKTERYNGENREKEKSCFVPVAPLI